MKAVEKLPASSSLFAQDLSTQPCHYFQNALEKESDPLLIREGTPISKGDPNDFPSPRQNPRKVQAEVKKNKYGQIISTDDPKHKSQTPQKYYDSLPCTFDEAPDL